MSLFRRRGNRPLLEQMESGKLMAYLDPNSGHYILFIQAPETWELSSVNTKNLQQ